MSDGNMRSRLRNASPMGLIASTMCRLRRTRSVKKLYIASGVASILRPCRPWRHPVTRLKLSVGPIGARIAYTRAMCEHWCFPKKRLSTHTMHFKRHHRNLSKNDHESLETNHEWRHAFIINTKNAQKYPKKISGNPDEAWSVQLFLPGPWRFLLGPCPRGPHPGDGAAPRPTGWVKVKVNGI